LGPCQGTCVESWGRRAAAGGSGSRQARHDHGFDADGGQRGRGAFRVVSGRMVSGMTTAMAMAMIETARNGVRRTLRVHRAASPQQGHYSQIQLIYAVRLAGLELPSTTKSPTCAVTSTGRCMARGPTNTSDSPASNGSALLTHCAQRACAPSEPELSSLGEPSIRRTSVGRAPSSACLQIWLLSGPVGAVAVGMTTARPTVPASLPGAPLREQTSPGHRRAERTLTAGEGRPLGPGHFRTYPFLGLRIVPADWVDGSW
jgi:hypothetical protein